MPHVVHTQCKEYKLRVYLGHNENVTPLLTDFIIIIMALFIMAPYTRGTLGFPILCRCYTLTKQHTVLVMAP